MNVKTYKKIVLERIDEYYKQDDCIYGKRVRDKELIKQIKKCTDKEGILSLLKHESDIPALYYYFIE